MSGLRDKMAGMANCCFGGEEEGEVIKKQPASNDSMPAPPAVVPYLPAAATASGRDVYLVEKAITMSVNGQLLTLDTTNMSATTSLASYLRDTLQLYGTKTMCYQAGCGVCIVTATYIDASTGQPKTRAVNSCITPLLKCDGWSITTVEGVGQVGNLNDIQSRLASYNGTQCGFCTPGFINSMHSLRTDNPNPTTEQIENAFDGNLCRCTGYRPIFDAFKSFAKDQNGGDVDIEDLINKTKKTCPKSGLACSGTCSGSKNTNTIQYIRTVNGDWMKPLTLNDLMAVLNELPVDSTYQLVTGNTAKAIYSLGPIDTFIDITMVPELKTIGATPYTVGGGVSITDAINSFESRSSESGYEYLAQLASHLNYVANTSVRNVGSLTGNLMLKRAHPEFPSDVFVLLEAAGATVHVRDGTGGQTSLRPVELLSADMNRKVIEYITFPQHAATVRFTSYKTTPRRQNAHAYINAAFAFDLDGDYRVNSASIVFGGYGPDLHHATETEGYLVGRQLTDQATLTAVVDTWLQLDLDISTPDLDPVLSSIEYRTRLVKALYYKAVLYAIGDQAPENLRSGATQVPRGISSGMQTVPDGDSAEFPVHQAVEKLEAKTQCTGEAEYIFDIPPVEGELHAAYVLAAIGPATFNPSTDVDVSAALAVPGVVAYVGVDDIPGRNDFSVLEEVFSSGTIGYAGQPIGLIVADTRSNARSGARQVVVNLTPTKKPVIDAKKPILPKMLKDVRQKQARKINKTTARNIEGHMTVPPQYHFHMETQNCIVRPVDNCKEYDIYLGSQWQQWAQRAVATVLGIKSSDINMYNRRIGGAYGAKITRANMVACACALAAAKVKRPVRLMLSLSDNMRMVGKRPAFDVMYSGAVDGSNNLQSLTVELAADGGHTAAEGEGGNVALFIERNTLYKCATPVAANGTEVKGNVPNTTSCRAPVTTQVHAIIDTVMEHLAVTQGMDPMQFRMNNLGTDHSALNGIVETLKTSAGYDDRLASVAAFNAANKWKKRGLGFTPLNYEHMLGAYQYSVQVAIYKEDGSISISHGGIEIGQGVNTKVAQVVAREFGLSDMSKISVKPSNNFVSNNNNWTGGSQASDNCCFAAIEACKELITRMNEFSSESEPWLTRVKKSAAGEVDLTARYTSRPVANGTPNYFVYGATLAEVEVDVLTGEKNIVRVDLIEDVGTSVSPMIDMGQVEGGFIMALGMWTTEEIKYDPDTGALLTFDTWEYKPPASQDIPEDFRITFTEKIEGLPSGPLGGKCTGEPSVNMGVAIMNAIRNAIQSVQIDLGAATSTTFVELLGPATTERVQMTAGVAQSDFTVV